MTHPTCHRVVAGKFAVRPFLRCNPSPLRGIAAPPPPPVGWNGRSGSYLPAAT